MQSGDSRGRLRTRMPTPAGSPVVFHLAVAEENRQRKRLLQASSEFGLDRKSKLGHKVLIEIPRGRVSTRPLFFWCVECRFKRCIMWASVDEPKNCYLFLLSCCIQLVFAWRISPKTEAAGGLLTDLERRVQREERIATGSFQVDLRHRRQWLGKSRAGVLHEATRKCAD